MSRRDELQITALQASTASLTAQLAALSSGSITMTKPIANVVASTGNFFGPAVVPAWTGAFSATGGHQAFFANFTALTGEYGGGLRTYQLFIDGAPVASKTITHTAGEVHYAVSIVALTQLAAGSHAFGIAIPASTVANDGDFADVLIVEF